MKGLILKDLLTLKNQMRNIMIIIIGFIVLSILMKNYFYIAFVITFYIVMLVISTFSYDELNNANTYIVALPYNRKTIVKARYYLSLMSIITSLLIGAILSFLIPMLNQDMDFMSTFASTLATIIGVILVISLLMPCFYKFGVQKGRVILFIAIMAVSLIIGVILSLFENSYLKIAEFFSNLENINYIILVVSSILIILLILYISYLFSYYIFKNKEF